MFRWLLMCGTCWSNVDRRIEPPGWIPKMSCVFWILQINMDPIVILLVTLFFFWGDVNYAWNIVFFVTLKKTPGYKITSSTWKNNHLVKPTIKSAARFPRRRGHFCMVPCMAKKAKVDFVFTPYPQIKTWFSGNKWGTLIFDLTFNSKTPSFSRPLMFCSRSIYIIVSGR